MCFTCNEIKQLTKIQSDLRGGYKENDSVSIRTFNNTSLQFETKLRDNVEKLDTYVSLLNTILIHFQLAILKTKGTQCLPYTVLEYNHHCWLSYHGGLGMSKRIMGL